jgi:hypothetical protein
MFTSMVLIIEAESRDAADGYAVAFGITDPGVHSFETKLSPTGEAPATHYALHSWASDECRNNLTAAAAGTLSPLPEGVEQEALQSLVSSMVRDEADLSVKSWEHFAAVITANGLVRIPDEEI